MSNLGQHSVFLVIDELGIDPLRDKAIDAIKETIGYEFYVVKSGEQHNSPLIAYNVYRDEKYWWHIQVYNDIDDMFDIKTGTQIKIPDMNEMTTRLQAALNQNNSTRTVSI
jgi:hypothetical protein